MADVCNATRQDLLECTWEVACHMRREWSCQNAAWPMLCFQTKSCRCKAPLRRLLAGGRTACTCRALAYPWNQNREMQGGVLQGCRKVHMADAGVGWPQADLYEMVPWLLTALAEARSSHPESAERTKAAALQLLPPLLDGLHARMLILLNRERTAQVKRLLMRPFFDTLVRSATVFAHCAMCVCPVQVLRHQVIVWWLHTLQFLLPSPPVWRCEFPLHHQATSLAFRWRTGKMICCAILREGWLLVSAPFHVRSLTGHLEALSWQCASMHACICIMATSWGCTAQSYLSAFATTCASRRPHAKGLQAMVWVA